MAQVTITIPDADVPDAIEAFEAVYLTDCITQFYGADPAAYATDTLRNRGANLIKTAIIVAVVERRRHKALAALSVTVPVVT